MSTTTTARRRRPAAKAAAIPATPGGLSEAQAQQLLQAMEQTSGMLEQATQLLSEQNQRCAALAQELEAARAERTLLAAAYLGVDPAATPAALRSAYRARSRDLHPDAEGGSAEGFHLLQRAMEILRGGER
jgi:hypothetical protein